MTPLRSGRPPVDSVPIRACPPTTGLWVGCEKLFALVQEPASPPEQEPDLPARPRTVVDGRMGGGFAAYLGGDLDGSGTLPLWRSLELPHPRPRPLLWGIQGRDPVGQPEGLRPHSGREEPTSEMPDEEAADNVRVAYWEIEKTLSASFALLATMRSGRSPPFLALQPDTLSFPCPTAGIDGGV